MKDLIFAAVLAIAFGLITAGAATFSTGAGYIVGGVLLTVWSMLLLGDQ